VLAFLTKTEMEVLAFAGATETGTEGGTPCRYLRGGGSRGEGRRGDVKDAWP
jgi:hypothetical protein